MTDRSVLEQLDEAVDFVIAHHRAAPPRVTPAIDELLQVAAGMRHVARPEFKAQLKTALREHSGTPEGVGEERGDLMVQSCMHRGFRPVFTRLIPGEEHRCLSPSQIPPIPGK